MHGRGPWSLLEVNLHSEVHLGPRFLVAGRRLEVVVSRRLVNILALCKLQSGAGRMVAIERLVASRSGR